MEQQSQYIIVEGAHDNAEEYMFIEIDENIPHEEVIKFAQQLEQSDQVVETVAPEVEKAQKEPSKKRRFKTLAGRGKQKTKDGMYANVLKSFTKDWEAMVLRVAEKERAQDRAEEEREVRQQRAWEQKLIQQQSASLTKINNDFLHGLRELLHEYKNGK